jgi:hypothetical protein
MNPVTDRTRRLCLAACLAAATTGLFAAAAMAQEYPNKPVKLIVAFGPGSGNDIIARELAQHMSTLLGQSMVVENRPGGGGSLGTDVVAKAAPDGYTIGLGTSSQMVMNVGQFKTLPFDVERDLRAIGLVARTPMVLLANNKMPKTLGEVISCQGEPRQGNVWLCRARVHQPYRWRSLCQGGGHFAVARTLQGQRPGAGRPRGWSRGFVV